MSHYLSQVEIAFFECFDDLPGIKITRGIVKEFINSDAHLLEKLPRNK